MSPANGQDNTEQPIDEAAREEIDETAGPAEQADAAIEQLDAEDFHSRLKESDDRALRAQAELENFRKRARRDMGEQRRLETSATGMAGRGNRIEELQVKRAAF